MNYHEKLFTNRQDSVETCESCLMELMDALQKFRELRKAEHAALAFLVEDRRNDLETVNEFTKDVLETLQKSAPEGFWMLAREIHKRYQDHLLHRLQGATNQEMKQALHELIKQRENIYKQQQAIFEAGECAPLGGVSQSDLPEWFVLEK